MAENRGEAELIKKIAWMVRDWALYHQPLSEYETLEMEDAIPLATSLLGTVSAYIRETGAGGDPYRNPLAGFDRRSDQP